MTEQDYKFYLNEGIELTNQSKFEDALESLNKAIELNPSNALSYFSKAIAYHNLGQFRAAYENYGKAILLDKKMIDAYYNRAQAILGLEDATEDELKEALSNLETATELDPRFIDAHYYSAVVKKKLGLYESVIVSLNKVLDLQPESPYSKALKKLILTKYLHIEDK